MTAIAVMLASPLNMDPSAVRGSCLRGTTYEDELANGRGPDSSAARTASRR